MELPDFRECVAAVKFGLSWAEAVNMDPLDRRAFLYSAAIMDGAKVDWTTGDISFPQLKDNR